MLLEQQGHEVTIFEARDRIGGRVWTVEDWGYEAGGEWIDSDHHRLLALIDEFGLELEAAPGARGGVWRGEYRTTLDLWPEAKEAEDKLWELASNHTADQAQTLEDLINLATESDLGRWWLTANLRSDEGTDPDRIGLDGWLDFYRHYQEREGGEVSAYRIKGGAGQLIENIASCLSGELLHETPVETIHQTNEGVLVNGEPFDHVIVTTPPPCLKHIRFDPPLPVEHSRAFEQIGMAPIVKVLWRRPNPKEGNTLWDSPLQQTWDGTRGSMEILTAYICGRDAQDISTRGKAAIEEIAEDKEYRLHDWIADPWSRGGFSFMTPGFLALKPILSKPVGRIHFAGEHTAGWMGFMEGALESAERVVTEIL